MVFPQITKTSSTKSRVIAKKRTIVLSLQKMKILQWKYLYFLYIIVKGIFVNIRMRSSVATKLCKHVQEFRVKCDGFIIQFYISMCNTELFFFVL